MASSILVRDFLAGVSRQLRDTAPQFEQFSEVGMVDALNEGQRVIAKLLPHSCSRLDAIRLVAGARQSIDFIPAASVLPGDGSSPVDVRGAVVLGVHRLMGDNGQTPGRALRVVDREALDAIQPDWSTKTGLPREYTFDPRTPKVFFVSPGVAPATSLWAEVSMLADPTPVPNTGNLYGPGSTSTAKLSIDDRNSDDLFNYIMARMQLRDAEVSANSGMAQVYVQLFTNSLNAQVEALTGVNPNLKLLPLNPAAPATAS